MVPEGIALSFEHYQEYISSQEISREFRERIAKCLKGLPGPYAVRSSANVEDSNNKSYAGQFVTLLDVLLEDVPLAIRDVYQSAASFNRLATPARNDVRMGVIIQRMIAADCSGVLFSYNLIENDPESIMMEVTAGKCEKIVSGKVNPSLYIIDKHSGSIRLFEEGDQKVSLEAEKLRQVLENCKIIEKSFGSPQDIEFLFHNGKFYCLQSRSITTI
ncbi:MAG: PEP/pyruvate-binding domain-containing protein [Nanoarchaeota archaeon]|nr:PEP/pyruvate-binding domain-containing protein [Nanoarchaeota archaeon]